MANSSLVRTTETPPAVRKGHGAAELGPSDSTDSGSDVRGDPGFQDGEDLADDASLDTTLQEPDDPGARIDEDAAGERFEREQPLPGRDSVGNVERDTPEFDRGGRDSSAGR